MLEKLEKFSKAITALVFAMIALSYLFGFLVWNSFLGAYGFFEYELLQTRYISAGILFLLIVFLPTGILGLWISKYLSNQKRVLFGVLLLILTMILIPWYVRSIFIRVPHYLGGGRPEVISFLGTKEQITFLNNFAVPLASNAGGKKDSVQTMVVCGIYENREYIIFAPKVAESALPRVFNIRRDQLIGFEGTPPMVVEQLRKDICSIVIEDSNINELNDRIVNYLRGIWATFF